MAPLLPGSDRIVKTQRWSIAALLAYFEETQLGLLSSDPEYNFYALTPAQCAGYLLYLTHRNIAEARSQACLQKARSTSDTYHHWSEVVEILRGL